MVEVKIGDLFSSSAQTIVNTVNCVGIMGKGIALDFKNRYPEMFKDYVNRCKRHEVKLGLPYIYPLKSPVRDFFCAEAGIEKGPEFIINFPTKDHWRSVSRLSDIERGLEYLERHYQEWGVTSIAVPPLGCGHGQLEWRVVGPTLYRHFQKLDIPVEMYAPHGTPQEELNAGFLACGSNGFAKSAAGKQQQKIDPAWMALAEIVARIEREPYHWPVGRTTFQKIAFFATETGIPTGLNFMRGSYGPFSKEIKSLLTKLVNNGILHEKSLGRMFEVSPGRTYQDAACTFRDDLVQWEPIIDRITDLFLRMQTKQAEVAATVYFVARMLEKSKQATPSEADVLEGVKRWKQRRRPPLNDEDVGNTIRNLNILRWINVKSSDQLPLPKDEMQNA